MSQSVMLNHPVPVGHHIPDPAAGGKERILKHFLRCTSLKHKLSSFNLLHQLLYGGRDNRFRSQCLENFDHGIVSC